MKEIKKEIKTFNYEYEAIDGTIFKDEEECKKYEKSYKCTVRERFRSIAKVMEGNADRAIRKLSEDEGYECASFFKVTPQSEEDIHKMIMYATLFDDYGFGDTDFGWCISNKSLKIGETYIIRVIDGCSINAYTKESITKCLMRDIEDAFSEDED